LVVPSVNPNATGGTRSEMRLPGPADWATCIATDETPDGESEAAGDRVVHCGRVRAPQARHVTALQLERVSEVPKPAAWPISWVAEGEMSRLMSQVKRPIGPRIAVRAPSNPALSWAILTLGVET
jgi:hypothetical protein